MKKRMKTGIKIVIFLVCFIVALVIVGLVFGLFNKSILLSPYGTTCIDSDKGINSSVFGTVTLKVPYRWLFGTRYNTYSYSDVCKNSTALYEKYCGRTSPSAPGPDALTSTINCLGGCENGKCVNKCVTILKNGDINDKLDLVFVAINYTNLTAFYQDVNTSLYLNEIEGKRGLFSIEPFKSNKNKFNVYLIADVDKWKNAPITAVDAIFDFDIFKESVFGYPCPAVDQVIVIIDEPDKIKEVLETGGSTIAGFANVDMAFVGRYNIAYAQYLIETVAHEFGHSFGELDDSYVTQNRDATENDILVASNCDNQYSGDPAKPCPKWADVQGTGCYKGCIFLNWYRSSFYSLMGSGIYGTDPGTDFDPISIKILQEKLNSGKFTNR